MKLTPVKNPVTDIRQDIEQNRHTFIGGSDAGTILGLNPWKSAFTLWCEKTGRKEVKDISDLERIRLGNDLEQYVAQRFMEATGKRVKKDNTRYSLKEYPFMVGHIDRKIIGENAGLECKTTSQITKTSFETGDIPMTYYSQCVHYMAVTGADRWYLAVLSFQRGFFWFVIERNEEEIEALINAEEDFWQKVETDTQPDIDGSESTADTLSEVYSEPIPEMADISSEESVLELLEKLKQRQKELDGMKRLYESQIKSTLGEAEVGIIPGWKVTWKQSTRRSFDSKTFEKEHPELVDRYMKESTYRTLRYERKKENNND